MNNSNYITIGGSMGLANMIYGVLNAPSVNNYNDNWSYEQNKTDKSIINKPEFTKSEMSEITTESALTSYTPVEQEKILTNFVHSITDDCKSMDGEFSAFIDKNFWDLI